jgi:hypothetical protein
MLRHSHKAYHPDKRITIPEQQFLGDRDRRAGMSNYCIETVVPGAITINRARSRFTG